MRVVRVGHAAELASAAVDWLAEHLRRKPHSVLALPTGTTPIHMYANLVARVRAGAVGLDAAHIFNLDEYCGLAAADPHSYAAFIDTHLLRPLKLPTRQVCLLRGDAADLDHECQRYDAELERRGGVDLCVLGLGVNGHVAFNEPGSPWNLHTHIVHLTSTTRATHEAQSTGRWRIPAFGITMGIGTLLRARHVLLLIAGANKEAARQAWHRGIADVDWPVTSLLGHPSLTTIELCAPSDSP